MDDDDFFNEDYVLLGAIDFGTTYSGYAFSFKGSPEDIILNNNWGAELGAQMYKTPTCVMTDSDFNFLHFGHRARQEFSQQVARKVEPRPLLFEKFKMKLHNNTDLNRSTTIEATDGTKARAFDIFTGALEYLKDHLLTAVREANAQPPNERFIRWVLTVPAIWSDASKQFMREVAHAAGLMSDVDSQQLVIALEPEAASIFCHNLDIKKFDGMENTSEGERLQMDPGTTYMVIDAGGGTLDITVHEVVDQDMVREISCPSGDGYGGIKVDAEFERLMCRILGDDFISELKRDDPVEWLDIMTKFEIRKRALAPNSREYHNLLNISWNLAMKYQNKRQEDITQAFDRCRHLGVTLDNGIITLNQQAVDSLFRPVIDNIVQHIQGILDNQLQYCTYFFMVGGFSESEYLYSAIRTNFRHRVESVLRPAECSLAVLKGAVRFGHDPNSIICRLARKTYGTGTYVVFVDGEHDEDKRERVGGVWKCRDVFHMFVQKNEPIKVGDVRKFSFLPLYKDSTAVGFKLYSTDSEYVEYVDEDHVTRDGYLEVDVPDTSRGLERPVEVSVTFGGTELRVKAEDVSVENGHVAGTRVNFLLD